MGTSEIVDDSDPPAGPPSGEIELPDQKSQSTDDIFRIEAAAAPKSSEEHYPFSCLGTFLLIWALRFKQEEFTFVRQLLKILNNPQFQQDLLDGKIPEHPSTLFKEAKGLPLQEFEEIKIKTKFDLQKKGTYDIRNPRMRTKVRYTTALYFNPLQSFAYMMNNPTLMKTFINKAAKKPTPATTVKNFMQTPLIHGLFESYGRVFRAFGQDWTVQTCFQQGESLYMLESIVCSPAEVNGTIPDHAVIATTFKILAKRNNKTRLLHIDAPKHHPWTSWTRRLPFKSTHPHLNALPVRTGALKRQLMLRLHGANGKGRRYS
jgi:hypothetical protein